MKTIVVALDKEHPDGEAILRAGEIIKAGGPKAVPQAMEEFNRQRRSTDWAEMR